MLARNELGHRLAVLIVLGNGRRAERLAASLSDAGDIVPILASELHADDAVDVMIVDEEAAAIAAPEGAPQVLLASGPVQSRDRFAAVLPAGTEPALIAAAARLAAAGYHIVAGVRAAQAGEQLFRIRFQKTLGNTEGLKKLRTLKLDVARIKTVERQRTLAAEKAAAPVRVNAAPAKSTRTARKKAKKD